VTAEDDEKIKNGTPEKGVPSSLREIPWGDQTS
jgi:hypothetical protein